MKKNVKRKASNMRLNSKTTDGRNGYHVQSLTALEERIVGIIGNTTAQKKIHRLSGVSGSKKKVIKDIYHTQYTYRYMILSWKHI